MDPLQPASNETTGHLTDLLKKGSNMRKHTNDGQCHAETSSKRVKPDHENSIASNGSHTVVYRDEFEKLKRDVLGLQEARHKCVVQEETQNLAIKEHMHIIKEQQRIIEMQHKTSNEQEQDIEEQEQEIEELEQDINEQERLTELKFSEHASVMHIIKETASKLCEIEEQLKMNNEDAKQNIDAFRKDLDAQNQQLNSARAEDRQAKELRLQLDEANIQIKQLTSDFQLWKPDYDEAMFELDLSSQDFCEEHREHETTVQAKQGQVEKTQASLASRIKELIAQRKKLYVAENEAETRRQDLEAQLAAVKRTVTSTKSAATRASNKAHQESIRANARIAELQKSIGRLEKARLKHRAEKAEWNDAKTQLLLENQNAQGLYPRFNRNINDDNIIDMFTDLSVKISCFVRKHTREVTISSVEEHLTGFWVDIMPTPSATASLLRCPMSLLLFEAYLWRWIVDLVFRPDSEVWAGHFGQELYTLCSSINETSLKERIDLIADFHEWRSSSCSFLNNLCGQDYIPRQTRSQVERMVKEFSLLCEYNAGPDAVDDAMGIVKKARALDIERRQLKSDIILEFARPVNGQKVCFGMPFDDSAMLLLSESSSDAKDLNVDFIISPALVKSGNNHGTDYHQSIFLAKMNVICDIKGLLATQETNKSEPVSETVMDTKVHATPTTESLPTDEFNTTNEPGSPSQRVKVEQIKTEEPDPAK